MAENNLPARTLNRDALERVLGRAAELQTSTAEAPGELTEAQIIALGAEVGLSEEHVRQALAEERTRIAVTEERGFAAWLAGASVVSVARTVRGTPAEVLESLDVHMRDVECLQVKRRAAERVVWERRDDLFGNLRRNLKIGGRGFHLSRATDVAATVVAIDRERVHVRLDADLRRARSARVNDGGAMAVTGGIGSLALLGVLATGAIPLVGLAVPLVAAGALLPGISATAVGYNFARRHRQTVERVSISLEQILDRLEHGELRRQIGPGDVLRALSSGRR